MASRQTATVATSCSIWPHEILAFTTSTFPSLYSSHILAHFQVFIVQCQAINYFVSRHSCESITSGQSFSLVAIFASEDAGEVRSFCLDICEGSCINPIWDVGGPRLFSQNMISKIYHLSWYNLRCRRTNPGIVRYIPGFSLSATQATRDLTNWRQYFMRLSCYWSWISSSHCQSSCGSTRR